MLGPMLQNYCTKNAYEEARIPVSVSAVGEGSYRGEVYFVPGREARAQRRTESPSSTAIIVRWSPNTVNVLVHASVAGWIVVNRNWDDGWVSAPPYHAQPRNGLLAAAVGSGEHLVPFSYRPKSVMVGAAISAFSLIAAAVRVLARPPTLEIPRHRTISPPNTYWKNDVEDDRTCNCRPNLQ